MKVHYPPFLQQGDTIGIISTARKIKRSTLTPALSIFEQWGLNVKLGQTIGEQHHQWAGDEKTRAEDLQHMINTPQIRGIICARGGNGTLKIVDDIDFSPLKKAPKWIAGFSDVTVLHCHLNTQWHIPTLHSIMPFTFPRKGENKATRSLWRALFGQPLRYDCPPHPHNKKGAVTAPVIGGNLSTLYSLIGSPSEPEYEGKILFIEEVDEHLYHFDRMLLNLKRSGKLAALEGLAIGGLTGIKDDEPPYGYTPAEIITEVTKHYDYPVAFNIPAGHHEKNCALKLGHPARLQVTEKGTKLTFKAVETS